MDTAPAALGSAQQGAAEDAADGDRKADAECDGEAQDEGARASQGERGDACSSTRVQGGWA